MKNLKQILIEAQNNHTAIPSFNIDSFEIYQAVESVVKDLNLPCLVQLSEGEDKFIQAERLLILVKKAQIDGLPIYLNMDHGKNIDRLFHLVELGFDMVHFDGSDLDYQTNLATTTKFIQDIKSRFPDTLIEAEFNKISLVDNQISPDSFTSPDQALEFINQTKADLLAVSIGNLHGVSQTIPETINLELLQQIKTILPNQLFTLHGGSGISPDEISASIKIGIVKININTDLRLQFLKSIKTELDNQKNDKIYDLLNPVIEDLKKIIKDKFLCMM
ncbi:MAG: class II fructose-bisphosphate aldolase [Candidatus Shapirobacteria bacterium]|jgi:fructose-bisphosphate aldolase class II